LQGKISNEENATGRAKNGIAQAKIALHPKRRVSDVGPIQIIRDVEEKKKREQTPRDPTARTSSYF
jgi:hypothetical protein